jgi:hypothetical protein
MVEFDKDTLKDAVFLEEGVMESGANLVLEFKEFGPVGVLVEGVNPLMKLAQGCLAKLSLSRRAATLAHVLSLLSHDECERIMKDAAERRAARLGPPSEGSGKK